MLPYINIFGAALPVSPLILIMGIWLGTSLSEKHAPKHGLRGDNIFNLIIIGIAAYLIGGRLSFALQHPDAFTTNPINLLSRNFGLFDLAGGAIIGLIAAVVYAQRKQLPLWPTLDALTPALAVAMLAIPLSNLASGEAFGAPSDLPWAVELWGMHRHPVQIYEALAAGLILWFSLPARSKHPSVPGTWFLKFAGFSALARLFFEGFRGNSLVISALNIRTAQLISWLILAAVMWLFISVREDKRRKNEQR